MNMSTATRHYSSLLLLITTVLPSVSVHGARVLVIPSPMTSHCRKMMSIGRELLHRGHEVTLLAIILDQKPCLLGLNTEPYDKTFKVITPDVDPVYKATHENTVRRFEEHVFSRIPWPISLITVANPLIYNLCSALTASKTVLQELEQEAYDIALVDGTAYYGCLVSVPKHLGIPFVVESSLFNPVDVGMVLQTNKLPVPLFTFTASMSFPERLANTILLFLEPLTWRFLLASPDMSEFSDKLRNVDTRELIKEAALFLDNTDLILDYPAATFPNHVRVGGLTTHPSKPLPPELNSLMDTATDGVILVTFGTAVKNFPKQIFDSVLKALSKLTQQVILRHNEDKVHGNIKMMKWVPQNDILGHPNTRLFVSHCGKNGVWEAVYHGVPVLCMTVHVETRVTSLKIANLGIGSGLELLSTSVDEISATIAAVLHNSTIRANMKRVSAMFKDRPESSAQRAASAIEHVIKYGGSHLRAPDVSFIAYIHGDVWLVIFSFCVVIFGSVLYVMRLCIRSKLKDKND